MGINEVDELQDRIRVLNRDGYNQMVLDLGKVTMLSSTGMSMMLNSATVLREAAGDLHLAHLTTRVSNLLVEITRIGSNFRIFETAEQAVSGFSSEQ